MSRPPVRRLKGVRFRPTFLLAYVSVRVNGKRRQASKAFPLARRGAPPSPDLLDDVIKWQADTRKALRNELPEKGTLVADIDRFLALPYLSVGRRERKPLTGRTKADFQTWLGKWAKSDLGDEPRHTITQAMIERQLQQWEAEGYSPSSLNHLRQAMITLWRELDGEDHRCPAAKIAKYDESVRVRKGFFELDAVSKVLAALPPDYADVALFGSFSGWRRQEVEGLLWSEVDLNTDRNGKLIGGVIRLSPERSKNDEGRILPITGPLVDIMQRRLERRGDVPYVFTYVYGGKKTPARQRRIGDWRKRWRKACKAAGCEGALFHDFRRTVVRNLTRAGVPEKVAMGWTGHKTRSVFDRYNIVNEADLRAAGDRLVAHIVETGSKQPAASDGDPAVGSPKDAIIAATQRPSEDRESDL